ncbi:proteasome subunit beta type-6 [Tanacetum coccineum]
MECGRDASMKNSDDSLVKEQVSKDTSSFVESSLNVDKETVFLDKKIEFVKPKNHDRTCLISQFRLIVNTIKGKGWPKAVNTARPHSAVVNVVRVNQANVVKASACWVWRPTKLDSASITLKDEETQSTLLQILKSSRITLDIFSISTHRMPRIQLGQPATVKVAATLVRLLSYSNKNMLQTGIIVGGWDKYEGGKIYSIPLGGTIIEQPFAIGGSGSSYLYGFFDQAWKDNMTKEEAEQLVVKAVSLAIARDGASGGVVRTVIINSEGVTRNFYPGDKLPLWHDEVEAHDSLLDILNASEPMSI